MEWKTFKRNQKSIMSEGGSNERIMYMHTHTRRVGDDEEDNGSGSGRRRRENCHDGV
jgi:hypothetical protein